MVEPILKWVGGKRQLLGEITGRFPQSYDGYHEPFIGGGAVFFAREPAHGTINDLNPKLADFYRVIKEFPTALIEENKTHHYDREDGDYYYEAREEFNDLVRTESLTETERVRKASLLLYLNRAGYNGLYRENSDGEFNVPHGRHSNPDFVQRERIQQAHQLLQDIAIYNQDFEYITDEANSGDVVYFDPPYEPVSKTADFTQYSSEDFDKADQKRLRDTVVELDTQGVSVIVSNSPPVKELYEDYPGFTIDFVKASRRVNRDSDGRGDVAELLVTNVNPGDRERQTLDAYTS